MNTKTFLEALPGEIFCLILDHLHLPAVKEISRVSKLLRERCLPFIFGDVILDFTEGSFARLDNVRESRLCHFVTSLGFKLGRAKAVHYATGFPHLGPVSTAGDVVKPAESMHITFPNAALWVANQSSIGDADMQRAINFLVSFPRLQKVTIRIQKKDDASVPLQDPLGLYTLCQDRKYNVTQVCTLARGISSSRQQGLDLRGICLSNLFYPAFSTNSERSELAECLEHLLRDISSIQVAGDGFPIELLCRHSIGLQQLDLKSLRMSFGTLKSFLHTNSQSVRILEIFDVVLTQMPDCGPNSLPMQQFLTRG
ncbi:hypothetical protein AnigIFM59636_002736 [Aspergillus niger]|nr:hypothetical protein AnigIFM59636_002736 [Aspergillus niger]